jgi:hypothetical protein
MVRKASKENKVPLRVPPELPKELRNWVIDNMVAINRGTLPKNLAMEFISFLEQQSTGKFAKELENCLEEANELSTVD